MEPLLVVVNGPIASGKSAVARALAKEFRERGRRAAAIDLDLLYDMLDHRPKSDIDVWRRARQAAAALADRFWATGVELVIVEGPFWDAGERAQLIDALATKVQPRVVTLRVSFEEALRRAQGDPTRGISRDPAFLARNHADFERARAASDQTDLIVDTAQAPLERIAANLAETLLPVERAGR